MQNYFDINIYGAGPAGVLFASKFVNTNIKVALHEYGNKENKIFYNSINKVTGHFKFSKYERRSGFFGTASSWLDDGVGGHLFRFDERDFHSWPISYTDIEKSYNEIIKFFFL